MDNLRKVFSRESYSTQGYSNNDEVSSNDVPVENYKASPRQNVDADIDRMRLKAERIRQSRAAGVGGDDPSYSTADGMSLPLQGSFTGGSGSVDEMSWGNRRAWQMDLSADGENPPSLQQDASNNNASHSATNSNASFAPSFAARVAQQKLIKDMYGGRITQRETASIAEESRGSIDSSKLVLHDLCGEAASTDDVAWMNALYCLAQQPQLASVLDEGWTPLHVSCMGAQPPPKFIVKALLLTFPDAARITDDAGRLPLHFLAASSAGGEILQMLVEAYPRGLVQVDELGLTPLLLLLRNTDVPITKDNSRILLGDTISEPNAPEKHHRISLRRNEHLNLTINDLDAIAHHKVSPPAALESTLSDIDDYPADSQHILQKLYTWGKKNQPSYQEIFNLRELNPAAIPLESSMELPIHMVVRRLIVERSGPDGASNLHESFDGQWNSSPPPFLPGEFYHILRDFVTAYPRGLIAKDAFGLTPLLVALLDRERAPNLDVVELLLGCRSVGHVTLPAWAQDIPLNRINSRYTNPAMIPNHDTGQLPLHIAAEEFMDNHALISSIHSEYPGAICVQDNRGKTPLHHALFNFRKVPINPTILSFLSSNQVAKIRDDTGKLPIDYLFDGAVYLPPTPPTVSSTEVGDDSSSSDIYRDFFGASLQASADGGRDPGNEKLMRRLGSLPQWLRAPACGSHFVRTSILEELSRASVCFVILFDGVLLLSLLLIFSLQVERFYDRVEDGVEIDGWFTVAIYSIAATRLLFRIAQMTTANSFKDFTLLYFCNLPFWIDCAANVMTIIVSVLLNGVGVNSTFPGLGSATVALLWLTSLTYLSMTFHGMSVFMGTVMIVLSNFIWPLLLGFVFTTGFAQLFFTLLQYDCAIGATSLVSVCGVRDSYQLVYLLLRGESLVNESGETVLEDDVVVLIALFVSFGLIVLLGSLASIVLSTLHLHTDEIANEYFWQQRLSFVLSFRDWFCLKDCLDKTVPRRPLGGSFWKCTKHSEPGSRADQQHHWVMNTFSLFTIILEPLATLLGLLSLGLLLTPAKRKRLFGPAMQGPNRVTRSTGITDSRFVTSLRSDIASLKAMIYERTGELEVDLAELREVTLYGLKE